MDPPKAEGGGASCSSGQSWSPGVDPRLLNVLMSSNTGVLSPTSSVSRINNKVVDSERQQRRGRGRGQLRQRAGGDDGLTLENSVQMLEPAVF